MNNNTEIQTAAPASTWSHLDWFQIMTDEHHEDNYRTPAFRNGRQQIPLAIHLTARNGLGEFHTITQEEMSSLKIINYYTSEVIPHTWSKNQYDYHRDYASTLKNAGNASTQSEPEESEPAAGLQVIFLWITTQSLEVQRIAASITAPDGTLFSTNSAGADPGGAPTNGKFNSSLSIVPIAPLVHRLIEFSMKLEPTEVHDTYRLRPYTISFIDTNFEIRWLIKLEPYNGELYFHTKFAYGSIFHLVLCHYTLEPFTFTFKPYGWTLEPILLHANDPKGTASAVSVDIGLKPHIERLQSAKILIIDNFGNESVPLWLVADDDGVYINLKDKAPT